MPKPVVVIAHWQIPAESRADVLALIADLVPRSLAEPGCMGYEVFQRVDRPTDLVLVERYVDRTALDAHANSPDYQDLVATRIRPLLTNREVHVVEPVDVERADDR